MGYFLVEKNKNSIRMLYGVKKKLRTIRMNPYPTETRFLARVLGKLKRSYKNKCILLLLYIAKEKPTFATPVVL